MTEHIRTEMKKIKRSRGTHSGTVTKAENKLNRMADNHPTTYDIDMLEKTLSTIKRAEELYKKSMTDAESLWVDV